MSIENSERIIVVAVDESKQAESALRYYMENMHHKDHHVILVHAFELPIRDAHHVRKEFLSPYTMQQLWKEAENNAKKIEAKFRRILKTKGIAEVKMITKNGTKPGPTICDVAEEEKATLIVIGTRGKGRLHRTVMGSCSEYVLHHSECPVVIHRKSADVVSNDSSCSML